VDDTRRTCVNPFIPNAKQDRNASRQGKSNRNTNIQYSGNQDRDPDSWQKSLMSSSSQAIGSPALDTNVWVPELILHGGQPAGDQSHQPGGGWLHYFLPDLWFPSQQHSITALWPVPNYTAW